MSSRIVTFGQFYQLISSLSLHRRTVRENWSWNKVQIQGRAVAEAVRRWLSTFAGPSFAPWQHMELVVDKGAMEQIFSEYFCFPCQSFH
jgi:hypothetical protein